MTYRKIGGIHWFSIGRWRISICRTSKKGTPPLKLVAFDKHQKPIFKHSA